MPLCWRRELCRVQELPLQWIACRCLWYMLQVCLRAGVLISSRAAITLAARSRSSQHIVEPPQYPRHRQHGTAGVPWCGCAHGGGWDRRRCPADARGDDSLPSCNPGRRTILDMFLRWAHVGKHAGRQSFCPLQQFTANMLALGLAPDMSRSD